MNRTVKLVDGRIVGTGALRSLPDLRDYSNVHERIMPMIEKVKGVLTVKEEDLPGYVNLEEGFSPIEDQGPMGTCGAHAGVGILEYMERAAFDKHIDASRMFLYDRAKYLAGQFGYGDTGTYLRYVMAAIRLFGVPNEEFFPYEKENMDTYPDPEAYQIAQSFAGLSYFRHDAGENTPAACALLSMKRYLAAGIPSMFGFVGFQTFNAGGRDGDIPLPGPGESGKWAHGVDSAGYSDTYEITNTETGLTSVGAIKLRNSWGDDWGNDGYGWIPYDYFLRGYCWDMWSLISMKWVDTGAFGI